MVTLFDNSTLPMLEQVVNFAQKRHGVLAGNIANLDTPGYEARDISPATFQARLQEAAEQQRRADAAPSTDSLAYDGAANSAIRPDENAFAEVAKDLDGMLRHDGNNTSMEQQITEMAKNQQQHNMAITLMNQQFRLLRLAIAERF